jgi:hypothetical protein
MKKALACTALAIVILAAGGWIWHALSTSENSRGIDGYPVVCRHCGHFFAIEPEQAYTYPKGPHGEGFKCEKCGKFGAQVAVRCEKCKGWYVAERGAQCPRCTKDKPAEKKS